MSEDNRVLGEGETVIAEWSRHQSNPQGALPKRYRLEVHAPQTRDSRDRVLYYKTQLMARLNAWMARQIGADRILIVDTRPETAGTGDLIPQHGGSRA